MGHWLELPNRSDLSTAPFSCRPGPGTVDTGLHYLLQTSVGATSPGESNQEWLVARAWSRPVTLSTLPQLQGHLPLHSGAAWLFPPSGEPPRGHGGEAPLISLLKVHFFPCPPLLVSSYPSPTVLSWPVPLLDFVIHPPRLPIQSPALLPMLGSGMGGVAVGSEGGPR